MSDGIKDGSDDGIPDGVYDGSPDGTLEGSKLGSKLIADEGGNVGPKRDTDEVTLIPLPPVQSSSATNGPRQSLPAMILKGPI